MSNPDTLQEKLKAIIGQSKLVRQNGDTMDESVAQILQAVADEAYIEFKLKNGKFMFGNKEMMTGQEFYDRFKAEYYRFDKDTPFTDSETKAFWAARRAAGITENQEGRDE